MYKLFHKHRNHLHYIIFTIYPVGLSWDVDFGMSILRYEVDFNITNLVVIRENIAHPLEVERLSYFL